MKAEHVRHACMPCTWYAQDIHVWWQTRSFTCDGQWNNTYPHELECVAQRQKLLWYTDQCLAISYTCNSFPSFGPLANLPWSHVLVAVNQLFFVVTVLRPEVLPHVLDKAQVLSSPSQTVPINWTQQIEEGLPFRSLEEWPEFISNARHIRHVMVTM